MKSLRIFMLAGFCSMGTTAEALADELPGNAGAPDVSEGQTDNTADGTVDAEITSNQSATVSTPEQVTLPRKKNEAAGDDETAQPEVIHEERWVLGIQCDAADPLLRKHLKLGSAGLVILQVRAETPAAESDLQPGDLITHIDDAPLMCRDDLIHAVTLSNGATLKLSVLRDGDSRRIQVTPRRMMVPVLMSPAISRPVTEDKGTNGVASREARIFQGVLIQGVFPLDENNPEEIDVEALVKKLREMTAEERIHKTDGPNGIVIPIPDSETSARLTDELLSKNIAALKDHIQTLQKKLANMEARLKEIKPKAP